MIVCVGTLEGLTTRAEDGRGTNRLRDPNTGEPEESPSTLTVTPVRGGRFVRLDCNWLLGRLIRAWQGGRWLVRPPGLHLGLSGQTAGGLAAGRIRSENRQVVRTLVRHLAHVGRIAMNCLGSSPAEGNLYPRLLCRSSRP